LMPLSQEEIAAAAKATAPAEPATAERK
jgi:hypothetical protein